MNRQPGGGAGPIFRPTIDHHRAVDAVERLGGIPLSSSDVAEMLHLNPLRAHAILNDLAYVGVVKVIRGPRDTPLFFRGLPL